MCSVNFFAECLFYDIYELYNIMTMFQTISALATDDVLYKDVPGRKASHNIFKGMKCRNAKKSLF